MSLLLKCVANQHLRQIVRHYCYSAKLYRKRSVSLKPQMYQPPPDMDYEEFNENILKRPVSPHMAIYKLHLNMVASFLQRVSGAFVSFYCIGIAGTVVLLSEPICHYIDILEERLQEIGIGCYLVPTGRFLLALPFTYHYIKGMVHLFWDVTAWGLTTRKVDVVSALTIVGTILSAAALALIEIRCE